MLSELQEIINTTSLKQLPFAIKKNTKLHEWVLTFEGATLSEKAYNAINNQKQPTCANGNKLSFRSFSDGYKFCGRAAVCQCAKASVSEKVKADKNSYSDTKKQEIQSRRESTSLQKYGVKNNAQTETARQLHAEFYSIRDNVDAANAKNKQTKMERYGDENYNNIEKIRSTSLEKYGVKCTLLLSADNSNPNLQILQDKDAVTKLYNEKSIPEIADHLNVHIQTVYKYLNMHDLREPFKSSEEFEIVKFLTEAGVTNIQCNTRKILPSRKELDIYLPDHKLAIEYNGIYWHHEDVPHIDKNYHKNKFEECEQNGITLITIFSNVWKQKKEIVKSMLLNKLSLNRDSVPARKCELKKVRSIETKPLMDAYHLQGYTPAAEAYALFHNGVMVAAMTFSAPRIGIGKKREDTYELVRFCSSKRIIGGASKLLKKFIVEHSDIKYIVSYSNNEWSNGGLYKKLGFSLEMDNSPSYWYVKPKEEIMLHRFNFAKHKLIKMGYDETMTEREITKVMGLLKVWDCGKKTWTLSTQDYIRT